MTDVSNRKRQPRGVPIGGEFASNEHDEAADLHPGLSSCCAECDEWYEDQHECATPAVVESPFGTEAHERINGTDYKERVAVAREELEAAVAALDQDDNWQKHLDQSARFHSYSFTNQMLIGIQMPEATKVNSFKRWGEIGRQVKKGAKGITIFAPMFRKETAKDGTEESKLFGFKPVTVFDLSQTEGEPLAEIWHELTEEPKPGYVEDLTAATEAAGFTVEFRDLSKEGGRRGYTSFAEKKVVVDSSTSAGTQATTLAHELGHIACGHGDQMDEYHSGHGGERGRMEVEAESFAYTLSRINGMETPAKASSEYVAGWARGDKKELTKAADVVAKSVKSVLGDGKGWRNAIA